MLDRKRLGDLGEQLAADLVQSQGFQILARNFRSKFGEIDIVAREEAVLVFIEVKCRFPGQFGVPEEAVTPWKIQKIIKTGDYYLTLRPNRLDGPRVDVVAIEFGDNGQVTRKELIRNVTG